MKVKGGIWRGEKRRERGGVRIYEPREGKKKKESLSDCWQLSSSLLITI